MIHEQLTDEEAARYAKAVGHPIRIRMLRLFLDEQPISPVEFSRRLRVPLGNCSYHLKMLEQLGVVEVAGTIPRRGALEHQLKPAEGRAWTVVSRLLEVLAEA